MTLKEAVAEVEEAMSDIFPGLHPALKLILDTARERLEDTAEIVLPCRTCVGKGEVVHEWERMRDGTAAVSPCPTCRPKPTPVPPADSQ